MRRRRKHRSVIRVPVASMGDIAFLLIIFFMLASHFAQDRGNITLAKSPSLEALSKSKLSVMIDAQGKLFFNGRTVDTAADIENKVAALIKQNTERGLTNDMARTVVFKCDKGVGKSRFEPVIEAIAKAGGLVAAVGEKKESAEP